MRKFKKWNLKYLKNNRKEDFKSIEVDLLKNLINKDKETHLEIIIPIITKED